MFRKVASITTKTAAWSQISRNVNTNARTNGARYLAASMAAQEESAPIMVSFAYISA